MKNFTSRHKAVSLILFLGAVAVLYRLFMGLGYVSALSDAQPWGLTKALNILSGAALAAGGSLIATLVYVFGLKKFKPVARPALLMGFIAHTFVLAALLYDVGSPIDIWRIIIRPNIKSVMFLAFLCEFVYTAAVVSEVVPEFLDRAKHAGLVGFFRTVKGPVIVLTAFISVFHQSTLGALYIVSPHRIDPFWYTPWLPVLFFLSACASGIGMLAVEAYLSQKADRRGWGSDINGGLGLAMGFALAVYVTLRVADIAVRGGFTGHRSPLEMGWFTVELVAGFLLPAALLMLRSFREKAGGLFLCGALVALGVVMNRLGVVVVGWQNPSGVTYFPTGLEIFVSFCFLLAPVAIYSYASEKTS